MNKRILCPTCEGSGILSYPDVSVARPKIRYYVDEVARRLGVHFFRLIGPQRTTEMVWGRDVVVHLAHAKGYTHQGIGNALGGRDHTTIGTALRRAKSKLVQDVEFRRWLTEVEEVVQARIAIENAEKGALHGAG